LQVQIRLLSGGRRELNSPLLANQKLKESLDRVPVIKLSPVKLDACLRVLASTPSEQRQDIIRKILIDVYPGFTPKRAFRALVAPALTRLHFARSEPPVFRLAPNGKIWKVVGESIKQAYISVVLFDFAKVRLGLSPSMIPPVSSLREAARQFGLRTVDRVRGLDSMLRFYLPFHPSNWTEEIGNSNRIKAEVADVTYFKGHEEELEKLIDVALPRKRIIHIDEARYLLMAKMLSRNIISSSFVADEWLKVAIRRMPINAFKSAYATIDSLIIDAYPISAIMLGREQGDANG